MNNYDTSSTGDNIELAVIYDYAMVQSYYDDFVSENTRLDFWRDLYVYLVGDSGKPFYTATKLRKMKKAELVELSEVYEYYIYDTRAELIAELRNVTIKQHYEYLISLYNWHEFAAACPHECYRSHGYSQGDVAYVIDLKNGGHFNRDDIDHVLWDSPFSIYLSVNGDDELGYDLLDDIYKYDTDAVAVKVRALDISENAKDWIIENLPTKPKS